MAAYSAHRLGHPLPSDAAGMQRARRTALQILSNFGRVREIHPGPGVDPWRVGRYEPKYYKYVNWAFQTDYSVQEMEARKDELLERWST